MRIVRTTLSGEDERDRGGDQRKSTLLKGIVSIGGRRPFGTRHLLLKSEVKETKKAEPFRLCLVSRYSAA
jgi:hypothetical protein